MQCTHYSQTAVAGRRGRLLPQRLSHKVRSSTLWMVIFLSACLLSGCGGGGSSSQAPTSGPIGDQPAAQPDADADADTSPAAEFTALQWDLQRVEASQVGQNQDDVDAILDHVFTDQATQAVLVSKNGYVIGERYADGYNRESKGTSWSVAKSFYSAAVGVAIDEGLLPSVDFAVSTLLTEWADSDKQDITLKQVLQMRSGYPEQDNIFFAADQTASAIGQPLQQPDNWVYSNSNAQLFAPIIQRATGMNAHEFLSSRILQPIGIDPNDVGFWLDASATNPMTYCCLDMLPDDFLKFGLLYARGGSWRDKQIVSAAYVAESLTANGFYGYQWWVFNANYFGAAPAVELVSALGLDGQRIMLWPEQDVVVVVLTQYQHFASQGYVLDLTGETLNFPNTCSARNNCPEAEGDQVSTYNLRALIDLIAALKS